MNYQSRFDPSRENVGKIYRDAQLNPHDSYLINGDLTHELTKSLVDDINDAATSNPFKGRPFYITVHEKKDAQMPRAIHRGIYTSVYRPYPEDDTIVFWVDPSSADIRFCWCLPHWSEMDNILNSHGLYDKDYVTSIKAWKNYDLEHFGFVKNEDGSNWMANPNWKDKKLPNPKKILTSV